MKLKTTPLWITIDEIFPSNGLEKFLLEVKPFGVILFSRHLKTEEQTGNLISFIKSLPFKPLVGIDQEGGRVSRLSSLGYDFKGASEMDENPQKVKETALKMGEVLSKLGFDVNFAPVVDLGPALSGTGLEGRTYSNDEKVVTECAVAFLEAMNEFDIKGCLKHFPGLGGSRIDSHKDLPFIEDEDRERHLYPYTKIRTDFTMVAHCSYSFLKDKKPSSINKEVYYILKEIGCCDKIVTDDLKMGALRNYGDIEEVTKLALEEGSDIAMVICSNDETLKVVRAMKNGKEKI